MSRRALVAALVAHAVAVCVLLFAPIAAPRRVTFVQVPDVDLLDEAAPFATARGRRVTPVGRGRPVPREAAPPRQLAADSTAGALPPRTIVGIVPDLSGVVWPLGPQPGDGRLWVSPRPALPAAVAARLYGDTIGRDQVVVVRLQALVDSLNVILDEEQRAHRLPSWTADVAGTKFGIDSQYIHIAGIKIPTLALAALPITLPEGNYGEQERARQLQDIRDDIYFSAQRTATLEEFRQYVRELRARKEAEREAERRRREQQRDTVKAVQ